MNPEEQSGLLHQEWLNHPITKQFIKILSARKQRYIDALSAAAVSGSDIQIRSFALQFNDLDMVTTIITNTKTFVEQSTK